MIKTIKDIEVLFNEDRLTHVIINDKCEDNLLYAYKYRGKKVEIKEVSPIYLGFILNNGKEGGLEFEYIDIEATEKLIKEKEMTKSDLKDGMVVKLRNGDKMLVLNGVLLGEYKYTYVSHYDNILNNNDKEWDVVAIYKSTEIKLDNIINLIKELQPKRTSKIC